MNLIGWSVDCLCRSVAEINCRSSLQNLINTLADHRIINLDLHTQLQKPSQWLNLRRTTKVCPKWENHLQIARGICPICLRDIECISDMDLVLFLKKIFLKLCIIPSCKAQSGLPFPLSLEWKPLTRLKKKKVKTGDLEKKIGFSKKIWAQTPIQERMISNQIFPEEVWRRFWTFFFLSQDQNTFIFSVWECGDLVPLS